MLPRAKEAVLEPSVMAEAVAMGGDGVGTVFGVEATAITAVVVTGVASVTRDTVVSPYRTGLVKGPVPVLSVLRSMVVVSTSIGKVVRLLWRCRWTPNAASLGNECRPASSISFSRLFASGVLRAAEWKRVMSVR